VGLRPDGGATDSSSYFKRSRGQTCGEDNTISAEAFNAFIDAAEAQRSTSIDQAVDDPAAGRTAGIVTVRNDSGSDQERFAALGIATPLILPAENSAAFQERVALSLVLPDADQHADRLCILQEPIAAGALGRGLLLGVTPVRLEVTSEDDRAATVTTDNPSLLTTGTDGSARILWKEPGTGPKWGLVQIPAGGSAGGSPNLVLEVASASHPWFVGDVLRWNGSEWVFADAAVVGATDTLAVVGRIPDEDTALIVLWGICCLENLAPHTDYWLDPTTPGALTPIKPSETPRLVLHHAENGLCILRAGDAGSGGAATRFADLTDVDVVSVPPTDQQAALWDAVAERWKPRSVVVADPVPTHQVLAGPTSGTDAPPDFRDLAVEDLAEISGTSVVANPTAASARPTVIAADADDRALLRIGGTLQWLQIPEAVLGDGVVTTRVIGPGSVTDEKVVSVSWGKLTGVPLQFPPSPHDHPLGGDLTGTTSAAEIGPSAVGTNEIADGAVTLLKMANLAGPSVIGRVAGGPGAPSVIMAATDGGVLRRSGPTIGFAQITNLEVANGAAIAWSKINKAGAVAGDIGAAPAGHTHQLSGLGDVLITAPTVGQVLAYDAVNGRWINDDGGSGPGVMRPNSVWVNPTTANAEGTDLPATAPNRVLARAAGNLQWTTVARAMLTDGVAFSVIGRAGATDGPVADLVATPNSVLRRNALGEFGFAKITALEIDSQQSDSGYVLTSGFAGQAAWSRNQTLGSGAGSATSIQGSLVVVISNNGDYAKISSAGIELFRRSVSTITPLVKIDLNAYGAWTTAKAMGIREIDVCENGVPRKMLVLASAAY
jgi:hypothetical protein